MSRSKINWQDAFLTGDVRALARAISAAENDGDLAREFLQAHADRLGRAHVIGITGPPGAGKSTLTGQLTEELLQRGFSLGLLLVDPSSPFSGGAILGDRLRLTGAAQNPKVYARSMSSRGSMGGLAAAARDAIKLLDAFGKDIILVETVGTGQAETDIISVADTVVVVAVPGLGDDIQAMKAGILEIADLFVVNKADHAGADKTRRELLGMLKLKPVDSLWTVPVINTVALQGEGIAELADGVLGHYEFLQSGCGLREKRALRAQAELKELLKLRLLRELKLHESTAAYSQLLGSMDGGEISIYAAAARLWQQMFGGTEAAEDARKEVN